MNMRLSNLFLLLAAIALTLVCYLPGLSGSFIFDDTANISMNPNLRLEKLDLASLEKAAISGEAGILKRPISMVSFAINYYFSGDPYYFKATNLGIHLITGLLIFAFTKILFDLYFRIHRLQINNQPFWLAISVSAIWLLHPFNLTGVLYIVQRMTSLSAMFAVAGLTLYLIGRKQLLEGGKRGFLAITIAIFCITPLAALSKENGALLPLLILVCEITLLNWQTAEPKTRKTLMILVLVTSVALTVLGMLYLWQHINIITIGYSWRDFSLTDRVMTEARVIWFYLYMTLLPDMNQMGIHHDDIVISRSLLSPWTTLPAMAGLFVLAGSAFLLRRKHPILTFGSVFFLTGHSLESTIIPLEIAAEHRNYLPMLGILIPLSYYMLSARFHPQSAKLRRLLLLGLFALYTGLTASRASQWGDPQLMRMLEVNRHPNSVRANIDMGNLYNSIAPNSSENHLELYNNTIIYYRRAADLDPMSLTGLANILIINAQKGVPTDKTLITELERRVAIAPIGPPNKNSLVAIAKCIAYRDCTVDSKVISQLYYAALSNPTLGDAHKHQIISEFNRIPVDAWPRQSREALEHVN